jgi:hypothetical protein
MRKMILALTCALAVFGTGCSSLMPKPVELFQKEVKAFPEPSETYRETQRQAAALAEQRAKAALDAARAENVSTNVLAPAGDALTLSGAVSDSLGSPSKPASGASVADKLRHAMAKLDSKIADFKERNDSLEGKKIEDTGLFKVPYFVWLGAVLVLGFVGLVIAGLVWTALKVYATTNPPLALGLNAVQAGGAFAKKAVTQLLKGGEEFKKAVAKEVADPALLARVQSLFRTHQQINQDQDVQAVVKELTRKGE